MAPRARQAKGKARLNSYEQMAAEAEAAPDKADKLEITIPPGPRLGDQVVEAKNLSQGLRRPVADRGPELLAAQGRHRRGSSGRTGPVRPRCSG